MAFAKATLISRVRKSLNDNPFVDVCTEAMDTTETDLSVADTTKYDVGAIVEFQDDGERCLVTALASATVLTVIRNFDGATPGTGTTHAINGQILRDPVFPYNTIVEEIEASLRGLWPHVYKLKAYTITPVAGTTWYELDDGGDISTAMEISGVVQSVNSKPFWYGTRRGSYPVEIYHNVPTTIAGSGVAVNIPFLRSTATNITVNTIAKITAATSGSNYTDISEGIQADTIRYFAVAGCIANTDISRMTQEDISMSDESVRPMSRTQLSMFWENKAIRERRKWEHELRVTLPRKARLAGDGT